MLGQEDHQLLGDVDGHRHGLDLVVLLVLEAPFDGVDLGRDAEAGEGLGQADHEGVTLALVGEVGEVATVHGDDQGGAVVDDHPALEVEDAASGGLDGDLAVAVGGGLERERVRGHDLQVPEPGEERDEAAEHDEAEHAHPQAG